MSKRRALIFGKSGNVARALDLALWPENWTHRCQRIDFRDLDPTQVADLFERVKPSVVVNAAGYTYVDRAEDDREAAFAINTTAPGVIAETCAAHGVPFIHLSTDYVFDGRKSEPYLETDEVHPLSVYGESKAEGEAAVRKAHAAHVILRTSWVFSPYGRNFVKAMLALGEKGGSVDVIADQRGCPTAAADLARVIVAMAERLERGGAPYGTFHYAGAESTTWYDFAQRIFAEAAHLGLPVPARVNSVTSAAFGARAARPAYSVLDCRRIAAAYGVARKPWAVALKSCLETIKGAAGRA